MSRKVVVNLKLKLVLDVDEGHEIGEIVNELAYNLTDTTGCASVVDTEIADYEVVESK